MKLAAPDLVVQVDPSHCHYQIDWMQGLPLQWETLVPLLLLDNKVGPDECVAFFFGGGGSQQFLFAASESWLHFFHTCLYIFDILSFVLIAGSVTTWGDPACGGNSLHVAAHLKSRAFQICYNEWVPWMQRLGVFEESDGTLSFTCKPRPSPLLEKEGS